MEELLHSVHISRRQIQYICPRLYSHFRMRLTIYNKHVLSKVWKLYQEDFARTLRIQTTNQPAKFVELFLFWIDGHEDTRRPHSWDVPSWMYAIRYPMLDVLMWTLVWIGIAAIHLDYSSVDVAVWGLSICGGEKSAPSCYRELKTTFSE